jgi:hypothetical protein
MKPEGVVTFARLLPDLGERHQADIEQELRGAHNRCGCFGKEILPLSGIELRVLGRPAICTTHYTDYNLSALLISYTRSTLSAPVLTERNAGVGIFMRHFSVGTVDKFS